MKSTLTLIALTTLALSFGCATDPNKEVKAVDAAHAADVKETNAEEAKLASDQAVDHAVLDSQHEQQDSKMDKKVADEVVKHDADRDAAELNVVEARKSFRVSATARLEQVDAKAVELERKRAAKKAVEPALANLKTQAALVRAAVTNLDTVPDAKWFATKKTVEANLASLESEVSAIETRL